MGISTKKFRILNAQQFTESFAEPSATNYYSFIGRTHTWTDENNPPAENDTFSNVEYDVHNQLIAMKRIGAADVSHVVPRYDWESGEVYAEYSDNVSNLNTSKFYVLTDEFNVYKCISNNSESASTVKPTGISINYLYTSDGYIWKYMYTISSVDSARFVTDTYIPVKTLTSDDSSLQWNIQSSAVHGSLSNIKVNTGGAGYVATSSGNVFSVSSSTVINIPVGSTSGTSGYYSNSSIYIPSGTGSGQVRTITNYTANSTVHAITVDSPFSPILDTTSSYYIGPRVIINGDGQGAVAIANVSSGSISKIQLVKAGNNYTTASISFAASVGSGATASIVTSPIGGHGSNPVNELFGYNVMMNIRLDGNEANTFTTKNDYRIIGLMSDPVLSANGAYAVGTSYNMNTKLNITSASGTFISDETITGSTSGATGKLVESSSTVLQTTSLIGTFSNNETITGSISGTTAILTSVTYPLVKKYSGNIIYFENRRPISRADDQSEFIKMTIRF